MKKYLADNDYLIILCLGIIVFFQMSWVPGFFHDGYLYAAFGKNAAEKGFWLVPHLNENTYSNFYHHTSFVFILEGIFFKVFGSSYTSARIFAGLFSLTTGCLLFRLLKKSHLKKISYLAMLIFFLIPPLIKKSRFPNIDLPLMLFMFLSLTFYWKAFSSSNWKNWLLCGFFFGLSALTKGPMAAWIPMIIIVHLLATSKFKRLKDLKPWLGLTMGLLVFSLWPLSLYLSNNFEIFLEWYKFTFVQAIIEGRGASTPWYVYIVFLLKNVNIIFIFSLFGVYFSFKEKNGLSFFSTIIFFVIVVTLSTRGLKYSNYLIPLYPFLALLAANGISKLWKNSEVKIVNFSKYLIPITALVLLIFPITNESGRDRELIEAKEILTNMDIKPKKWINFYGCYPFWSIQNLNSYDDGSITVNQNKLYEYNINKDTIFLIHGTDVPEVEKQFSNQLKKVIYMKKRNIYLYISKEVKTNLITL
tara:strand:+ start:34055 stop:35476 length:1422 start_codon:yes stop_codon:yes gene_type:complete